MHFNSFSDRIRYYWADPEVQAVFARLMDNLGNEPLSLSLVSAFLTRQYEKIRHGRIKDAARTMIVDQITEVLRDYDFACGFDPKV